MTLASASAGPQWSLSHCGRGGGGPSRSSRSVEEVLLECLGHKWLGLFSVPKGSLTSSCPHTVGFWGQAVDNTSHRKKRTLRNEANERRGNLFSSSDICNANLASLALVAKSG